jgi:hypothetical protein
MTVQLEVMIADQSGPQEVRENLLLAAMLAPAVTLLAQVQIQDHLAESGPLRDQLAMTVLLEENGLIQDQLVMIELLVVNGLQKDQLVMTVLREENGQIQDQLVMTEDQEILVDQIVWKEMTTVREVLMVQETSLLTRRLSLKMLF